MISSSFDFPEIIKQNKAKIHMYLYKKKVEKITIENMRKIEKYQFVKRFFLPKTNPQGFDGEKNVKPDYSFDSKYKNVIQSFTFGNTQQYFFQELSMFISFFNNVILLLRI